LKDGEGRLRSNSINKINLSLKENIISKSDLANIQMNKDNCKIQIRSKFLQIPNIEQDLNDKLNILDSDMKDHGKTDHLLDFCKQCVKCGKLNISGSDLKGHGKTDHILDFRNKCVKCDNLNIPDSDLKEHSKTNHQRGLC